MAPKSPTKSLSTADNSDNNIDKDRPSWDTSPISKPGYLVTLCRWLPAQDENHRLLVERGVTMHRGRTVVVSDNHMDRHRHGLLPKGTFQKPTIVVSADHSDVGLPEAEALATPTAPLSGPRLFAYLQALPHALDIACAVGTSLLHLRHGPGRSPVATHSLPLARGVRLQEVRA